MRLLFQQSLTTLLTSSSHLLIFEDVPPHIAKCLVRSELDRRSVLPIFAIRQHLFQVVYVRSLVVNVGRCDSKRTLLSSIHSPSMEGVYISNIAGFPLSALNDGR